MKTIYIDFDNTIAETNKRVIDILNKRYNLNKTEDDLKDYGFNSIYPISESEKLEIFESDEFWEELEFKPGVLEVINKYQNIYDFVIVSKGTKINIDKKKLFINKYIPNVNLIPILGQSFDKSIVDMKNSIQIDDNCECLETNAEIKILYKSFNDFPWQQSNTINNNMIVNSWDDIDSILSFYSNYDCKTLEQIR